MRWYFEHVYHIKIIVISYAKERTTRKASTLQNKKQQKWGRNEENEEKSNFKLRMKKKSESEKEPEEKERKNKK